MALKRSVPVSLGKMPGIPGLGGETQVSEPQVSYYLGGLGQDRCPGLVEFPGMHPRQAQEKCTSQQEDEKQIRISQTSVSLRRSFFAEKLLTP